MPKADLKPFRRECEYYAKIVHLGSVDGPQAIDINMNTFTPAECRRFAAWLLKAADEVSAYNRKRKRAARAPEDSNE